MVVDETDLLGRLEEEEVNAGAEGLINLPLESLNITVLRCRKLPNFESLATFVFLFFFFLALPIRADRLFSGPNLSKMRSERRLKEEEEEEDDSGKRRGGDEEDKNEVEMGPSVVIDVGMSVD